MPVFKSRVPPFELDRRVLHHLLVEAVRTADPEAALDLHRMACRKLGHAPGWAWWTGRCRDVEERGRYDVALLGVEFALDVAAAPWAAVGPTERVRLEELRTHLHDRLAAAARADGVAHLRRPDRARFAERAQGAASTAG